MDKGVSAIQNVALLKHGYLNEIVIHYNFLYGIPGETVEQYQEMRLGIPRLYHLTPPVSRSEAIVTRFAPLHADPGRFGSSITKPVHHRCYDVLFSSEMLSSTGLSLDDYGYYFERYLEFDEELIGLYQQCVTQINHWKRQHREREVTLDYEDCGDSMIVRDTRFGECQSVYLNRTERAVYLACDEAPVSMETLAASVCHEVGYADHQLTSIMDRLDEDRLIWREGVRAFGLAVPREIAAKHFASGWRTQWTSIYR
jgi:hypothetical protein